LREISKARASEGEEAGQAVVQASAWVTLRNRDVDWARASQSVTGTRITGGSLVQIPVQ